MSKNYSLDDILTEVKHKKEQDPAARSISHADELVEEILMERESEVKKHASGIGETRVLPAEKQPAPRQGRMQADSTGKETSATPKAAEVLAEPAVDAAKQEVNQEKPKPNPVLEKQPDSPTADTVPEMTRQSYKRSGNPKEKKAKRGDTGYFTRSFKQVRPAEVEEQPAGREIGSGSDKTPRELMQKHLQAKVGLIFTQQLSDVPVKTKYEIVGGEKKLAEAQKYNTQTLKAQADKRSITEAFERAAVAGPVFRDTAPVMFDTKSSLKINLPKKKEEPEPKPGPENSTEPGTPEKGAEQAIPASGEEDFPVREEVLHMHEELSKKREEKVKKFHLLDTEEPDDEDEEEQPEPVQSIDDFESFEDTQAVQNDLNFTRFKVVFRLGVVTVLTVLSLYIGLSTQLSLPLPKMFSASSDPFLYLLINLGLIVVAALLCIGAIGRGLLSLFTFSPDSDSFCAAAIIGAIVQGAVFLTKPEIINQVNGLSVLAPVALIVLLCNCIGKLCMIDRIRRNFRLVSSQYEKNGIFVVTDEDFVFNMTKVPRAEDTVVVGHAKAGFLQGFLENSYAPDNADNISRYLAPICLGGGLVISIACYLLTNNLYNAVTVFAAVECMCAPAAATLGMNLPLLRSGKSLSKAGAMITGASAVMEYGDALGVMVDVSEIIRPSDVEVNGIKMMNTPRMDEAILNAASLVCRVDSPLSGLFLQILQNRKDLLKSVDSVIYEDSMGLSGWVDGKRVLVGNRQLMLNHSIHIPKVEYEKRTKRGPQYVVYVAVDGELSAMFLVLYRVSESVKRAMQRIVDNGFKVYIKTTDSNLDEARIAEMCGVDVGMLSMIPQYLYAEYDQKCTPRSNMKASVAYTGGIEAYFKALVSCVRLRSCLSLTSAFYLCSAGLGLGLIILFTLLGSTSVIKLLSVLIYQLFWIAATVIITNIKKY